MGRRGTFLVVILAGGAFSTALNGLALGPILKDIAADFGAGDARVGQLATLHALVAALVGVLAAPLLDRYGRRAVLRAECAVLLAGTLLSALAPDLRWLVAGRALAGVGGAIIGATCLASVGDLFPDPALRNRRIGLVVMGASLAGVLGVPLLGQVAAATSWRWAFGALALPVALVLAVGALLPSHPATTRPGFRADYAALFRAVLTSRAALLLLGSLVVVMAAWGGFSVYLGAFAATDYGADANAVSALYLLAGLAVALASNAVPRLVERLPPQRCYAALAAVACADLLLVGVFRQPWLLVPFTLLGTFALAGLYLLTSFRLLDVLPAARGTVLSLQSAGFELGVAVGAGVGGAALAATGDYPAVFRALACAAPLAMVLVAAARRQARPALPAAALPAPPA